MKTFVERLKEVMVEEHLTQAALANMVGVSAGAMSGYLSGKIVPPERKKEQIALALGKAGDFFKVEEVNLAIAADGGYRLKPKLAATLMGMSEKTFIRGLKNGDFPFGYSIYNPETDTYTHWISRIRFSQETGIPVPVK